MFKPASEMYSRHVALLVKGSNHFHSLTNGRQRHLGIAIATELFITELDREDLENRNRFMAVAA